MKPATREPRRKLNRENFVSKVISPAICGETCPICLRELQDCTAAVLTSCIHAYCVECIRKWSTLKRTCPLCNAQFESWFSKINFSSSSFRKEHLPTLNCVDKLNTGVGSSRIDSRRWVFWYVFYGIMFSNWHFLLEFEHWSEDGTIFSLLSSVPGELHAVGSFKQELDWTLNLKLYLFSYFDVGFFRERGTN